jgi:LysM repeat protein
MTGLRTRGQWGRKLVLGALLLMTMGLAACFQPQGDTLEATTVSMIATFTPPPSLTPEGPPTETPFQLISVTNTVDPLAEAQTQVALAEAQQQAANVVDPFSATATAMALGLGLSQPADLPLQPIDPMMQTATMMAFGVILPTTDPLQPIGPTLDPLFITATAYIEGATQTAAAPMTQTFEALFPPTAIQPTLPPFTTATAVPPVGSCTHVVSAGENLFRISLRYNTTVNAIAAANGIVNPALILVGQTLTIPNCGTGGGGGVVIDPVPPPGGLQPGEQIHTVRQGETLMTISLTYGVPVNSIAARNNLANPNMIFINQQLVIPAA